MTSASKAPAGAISIEQSRAVYSNCYHVGNFAATLSSCPTLAVCCRRTSPGVVPTAGPSSTDRFSRLSTNATAFTPPRSRGGVGSASRAAAEEKAVRDLAFKLWYEVHVPRCVLCIGFDKITINMDGRGEGGLSRKFLLLGGQQGAGQQSTTGK